MKRLGGKIDRVLVDAPCSGFGTLRRNPDLKWRQNDAGIAELAAKQRAILTAAAHISRVDNVCTGRIDLRHKDICQSCIDAECGPVQRKIG